MTRIATFNLPDWYDQIEALGQLHKAETEAHLHDQPCVLNRTLYDALFAAGVLVCVGVFADGCIVGYAVATVAPHPHYALTAAQHDSLFIHPDYRAPRLALRLVESVEAECKARGALFIAWHAKPGTPFARLLERRAHLEEHVYTKEL